MKKFYLFILLIISPSVFGQIDLKNGLIACFPFNNNANDVTNNGHHGTINGAILTSDRFGRANSAYDFDGNSFIQLANADGLKNNTFTYAAWVNMPVAPDPGVPSAYSVLAVGSGQVMHFVNRPDEGLVWGFTTYNNENISYDKNPSSNVNTTLNTWHHFVISRNETQSKIYIDGVLIMTATSELPTTATYTSSNLSVVFQTTIGTRPDEYNIQFFRGKIDDIHIYDRAIDASEVKALFDGNMISITANQSAPCGGNQIIFTANGATASAKYQWKVDGVNVGTQTTSSTFSYDSPNKTSDFQVKISVEVIENDLCFPNKISTADSIILIKNCNPCDGITSCIPFDVKRVK